MITNELYLVVLPMVHLGINQYGLTEQVITLMPDKNFATRFFQDEVETYQNIFERRANQYLSTGHVKGYAFDRIQTADGRWIVKVTQHVG
jgi:hypothetical protein